MLSAEGEKNNEAKTDLRLLGFRSAMRAQYLGVLFWGMWGKKRGGSAAAEKSGRIVV